MTVPGRKEWGPGLSAQNLGPPRLGFPHLTGWRAHPIVNSRGSGCVTPPASVGVPPTPPDCCRENLPNVFSVCVFEGQGTPSQVAGPGALLLVYRREDACVSRVS